MEPERDNTHGGAAPAWHLQDFTTGPEPTAASWYLGHYRNIAPSGSVPHGHRPLVPQRPWFESNELIREAHAGVMVMRRGPRGGWGPCPTDLNYLPGDAARLLPDHRCPAPLGASPANSGRAFRRRDAARASHPVTRLLAPPHVDGVRAGAPVIAGDRLASPSWTLALSHELRPSSTRYRAAAARHDAPSPTAAWGDEPRRPRLVQRCEHGLRVGSAGPRTTP